MSKPPKHAGRAGLCFVPPYPRNTYQLHGQISGWPQTRKTNLVATFVGLRSAATCPACSVTESISNKLDIILVKNISERPFISFLVYRNRDFCEKMSSNSLFKISKHRHPLLRISRYPKMESENDSLDYMQEKRLKTTRIYKMIFIQISL